MEDVIKKRIKEIEDEFNKRSLELQQYKENSSNEIKNREIKLIELRGAFTELKSMVKVKEIKVKS